MKPTGRLKNARGFVLIDLLFVCGIIGVISTIALPGLLTARQSAGAASAIGSLRTINSAQLTFALTCGGGFYAADLTSLGTPPVGSNSGFVGPSLSGSNAVTRSGYLIEMSATAYAGSPVTCNGFAGGQMGQAFRAGADPLEVGNPRYFGINANGTIFEHTSTLYPLLPEAGMPPVGHVLR